MIDISIDIKKDKAIINYDLEDNKGDLFFSCLGSTKKNSEWPDKTKCYISMPLYELMNNLEARMKEYFAHQEETTAIQLEDGNYYCEACGKFLRDGESNCSGCGRVIDWYK